MRPTQYLKHTIYPLLLCLVSYLGIATYGHAQVLQEVIVTAQKRAESLQDVSVSVTALSGEKLSDFGIARLEEVTAYVPNFVMSETGIGTTIYIRGIGSGINQGFEQSVGMYIDGTYYGRAQLARAPMFDMAQVEVLRGPQVTLFGNNSIGGAVSMATAKSGDSVEGYTSVLYNQSHGERENNLVISTPISDSFGLRLALRNYELGGYLDNPTLDRREPNRDYRTLRLNMQFHPNSLFDATLKLEQSNFDVQGRQIVIFRDEPTQGGAISGTNFVDSADPSIIGMTLGEIFSDTPFFPSVDGSAVINTDNLQQRFSNGDFSFNQSKNTTLTVNMDLDSAQLKSITSYLGYSYRDACDCDFTGASLVQYESDEHYRQSSQEFRYTSDSGENIEFIAGLYYQRDSLSFNDALIAAKDSALEETLEVIFKSSNPATVAGLTDLAGPRNFHQDSELYSAFSQLTWHAREDLRFTAGLRRSKTEKEAYRLLTFTEPDRVTPLDTGRFSFASQSYGLALQVSPHFVEGGRKEWRNSYTLIAEWDINEDVLLYASKVRGFKTGGFDARSNNPTDKSSVIDHAGEFVNPLAVHAAFTPGSFEFEDEQAIAYELGIKSRLGDSAEINASYFYTDIKNLQVSVFDGGVGFNVDNAAAAVSQGVEVDWRIALDEHWLLSGSLAWLDFEFKDYKNAVCTAEDRLSIINGLPNEDYIESTDFGADGNPGGFDDINIKTVIDGNCERRQQQFQAAFFSADLTGQTNQYVADYSASLSLGYNNEIINRFLFKGALDINLTDDYHPTQNLDPTQKQDGHEIYNVRLALADIDERWELVLLGRNITNETVITYSNDVPLASSLFGTQTNYGFVQRSRAWALQGKLNF